MTTYQEKAVGEIEMAIQRDARQQRRRQTVFGCTSPGFANAERPVKQWIRGWSFGSLTDRQLVPRQGRKDLGDLHDYWPLMTKVAVARKAAEDIAGLKACDS